jgi:hypothetical protein
MWWISQDFYGVATMSEDHTEAAVKATAQKITEDDALATKMGADAIPPDEVIVEPSPEDYVAPAYLTKTAPELSGAFGEMLVALRDLNSRFVGDRTVEAQAYLSLTGEHDVLEEHFLGWCQRYFTIRGNLNRLNASIGNDLWRLYLQCLDEIHKLLEYRIVQPGTINSSVLNLSQRFMLSGFAATVLAPDLTNYAKFGRDRFGSESHRMLAEKHLVQFTDQLGEFTSFLDRVAQDLPAGYSPDLVPDWPVRIRTKVAQRSEDLTFLRYVLCALNISDAEKRQIAPDLWARFQWDVYHGGSVGLVLTSFTPEPSADPSTRHLLAFRRDGWLCHREYAWLRVHPDHEINQRQHELAVNWFILDTLTASLYEAWLSLDHEPVVNRGLDPNATAEEQTAALAVALAEPDPAANVTPDTKRPRLRPLLLTRIKKILIKDFGCEWSMAKGSEQKVYRQGSKHFKFGCHDSNRTVIPHSVAKLLGQARYCAR